MHRHGGVAVGIVSAVIGCKLLDPYPGDGDPVEALAAGPDDGSPFDTGEPQEPLSDPKIDPSITVSSNVDLAFAVPGSAFVVDLTFIATNRNVVGGGIRFPNSEEVQWTLLDDLRDAMDENGRIQFGYVVDENICADIPNLCHEIETTQFAVGQGDGEFVVSEGVPVRVILECATCESPSCQELLEGTEKCFSCEQPQSCRDYFDRCLAEGMPNAGSDEEDLFDTFFGPDGVLWSGEASCETGKRACDKAQENADAAPDVCEL